MKKLFGVMMLLFGVLCVFIPKADCQAASMTDDNNLVYEIAEDGATVVSYSGNISGDVGAVHR